MNKYEMIYILDTACTDEKKDALIAKVEKVVAKAGGTVEKTEKWGTKKLAYPIDYKTEGYYVYMAFEGDCNLVQEMKRVVGISEGVIRRLITKR
jgi:small subunit ribosomal protein S6